MGWENVFQVEWDDYCQKVLAKNFPNSLRFGDIKEFNNGIESFFTNGKCLGWEKGAGENFQQQKQITKRQNIGNFCTEINIRGGIDVLSGGFPCQPFSHAGKRQGVADERYLWPEMLRTIRILKPSYVVGENVAGLVSMENGKTLDRILSDLENEGYTTEQIIIPACAVGAWHKRDRIWIIAYTIDSTNRTNRGESRKAESISCERGTTGLTRMPCGTDTEIFSNCNNQGFQGREEAGDIGAGWQERNKLSERHGQFSGGHYWQSEPSVGGMVNGLPCGMDGYWDREPEGIGRVATGIKDRVDRLKALGNAIVPQTAFEIFKAIEQLERELKNHE